MATTRKPKPKPEANGTAERPEPEVLTLGEAAAFLRVSDDGLRLDAEAGRVPARRVAGEWRFMHDALRDWLSQPSEPTASQSNKALAEHIRLVNREYAHTETDEEVETFLGQVAAGRASTTARGAR